MIISFSGYIAYDNSYNELLESIITSSDDIELMINSEGGDFALAYSLYDLLIEKENQGFNITTIAFGKVQSAAIIPFLAGKKRFAYPNVEFLIPEFMIQNFSLKFSNETIISSEFKSISDHIQFQTEKFISLLKTKSNKTFQKMLDSKIDLFSGNDYFYSSEHMKEYGIVTKIIGV